MVKNFEIPGKFSIDLADVRGVFYDADLETVHVTWKDAKKTETTPYPATEDDFAKLQQALAERPAVGV